MKRITALICSAVIAAFCLCSCDQMDKAVNDVKEKASEVISDRDNEPARPTDNKTGPVDSSRESVTPTNDNAEELPTAGTDDDKVGEDFDEMIDNGEVEDGDGNIGERENEDGDGNIDYNTPENEDKI